MKIPESAFEDLGNGKIRVRYKDGGGTWRRKVIEGKTAAKAFYTNAQYASLHGNGYDAKKAKTPLRIFAWKWFEAQPDSPHTRQNKRSHLANHLLPSLGDRPIGGITELDMQKWIKELEAKGLGPNSIRHISGTANSLFKAARRAKYISENPCTDWTRPKVPERKMVPATIEQIHSVIKELDERIQVAALTAAGSGVRPAELFGLKVDDLDATPKNATLHIRRQVHSYTGSPQQEKDSTKTSRDRVVFIHDSLAEMLLGHIARYSNPERFIFINTEGKPLHAHVFNRAWRRARMKVAKRIREEAADGNVVARSRAEAQADYIEKLRFYDLRHFYGSLLYEETKNIKLVQETLGHTTAQMTMNNYVHTPAGASKQVRKATKKLFKIN